MKPIAKLDAYINSVIPYAWDDSETWFEFLGKVSAKVNEIIQKTNEYFSVDIFSYVSGVLDSWKEDGTLQNILEVIFDDFAKVGTDVYPETFGVIGDGVANDTNAFNLALDSMTAGDRLILNASKTYLINGSLWLKSNISIIGNGATIQQTAPNTRLLTTKLNEVVENVVVDNVRFIGIPSDYQGATNQFGCAISLWTYQIGDGWAFNKNITIKNCVFNMFGYAAIQIHTVDGFRISNNIIVGTGDLLEGEPGYIAPEANYQFGIHLIGYSTYNGIVEGNDISKTAQGIFNAYDSVDIKYINNFIHDIKGQHGFYLSHGNGLLVSGNTVKRCYMDGIKLQQVDASTDISENNQIVNNTIIDVNIGISVWHAGNTKTLKLYQINISDNIIYNAKSVAIWFTSVNNSFISNNVISSEPSFAEINANKGIVIGGDCANISVKNNIVKMIGNIGIQLLGGGNSDIEVSFNNLIDVAQKAGNNFGISIDACNNPFLISNRVEDKNSKMMYSIFLTGPNAQNVVAKFNYFMSAQVRLNPGAVVSEWYMNTAHGYYSGFPMQHQIMTNRIFRFPSIPTTGDFARGDRIYNANAAVGQPKGWICTASGTPGTWVSEGDLT